MIRRGESMNGGYRSELLIGYRIDPGAVWPHIMSLIRVLKWGSNRWAEGRQGTRGTVRGGFLTGDRYRRDVRPSLQRASPPPTSSGPHRPPDQPRRSRPIEGPRRQHQGPCREARKWRGPRYDHIRP